MIWGSDVGGGMRVLAMRLLILWRIFHHGVATALPVTLPKSPVIGLMQLSGTKYMEPMATTAVSNWWIYATYLE